MTVAHSFGKAGHPALETIVVTMIILRGVKSRGRSYRLQMVQDIKSGVRSYRPVGEEDILDQEIAYKEPTWEFGL